MQSVKIALENTLVNPDSTLENLKTSGLTNLKFLPTLRVVTGDISPEKLESLRTVEGVKTVREATTFGV